MIRRNFILCFVLVLLVMSYVVSQEDSILCGDGLCDSGERNNCPLDCGIIDGDIPEPEENIVANSNGEEPPSASGVEITEENSNNVGDTLDETKEKSSFSGLIFVAIIIGVILLIAIIIGIIIYAIRRKRNLGD